MLNHFHSVYWKRSDQMSCFIQGNSIVFVINAGFPDKPARFLYFQQKISFCQTKVTASKNCQDSRYCLAEYAHVQLEIAIW